MAKRASKAAPIRHSTAATRAGGGAVWRKKFLAALVKSAHVTFACQAAHVDRKTAYRHRKQDKEFAMAWDLALTEGVELLEAELWRRAMEGIDQPIVYKGEVVATTKKYSDTLGMFLLKAHRPEKYRERIGVKNESSPAATERDPAARSAEILRLLDELESAPSGGSAGGAAGGGTAGTPAAVQD